MNSDTTKQIIEALRPVADKIGQGAGHLYEVYVRQAYITGIRELIFGLLFCALTVVMGIGVVKLWDDDEIDTSMSLSFIGLGFLIIGVVLLNFGLAHLLNPEYYGIKDIICQAKGGC